MKKQDEFEKLFDLKVPIKKNFQYYVDTLMKNPFYAGLGKLIDEYVQYEEDVEALGYDNATSYKLDYALPKLKDYIINTEAYNNLVERDFRGVDLRRKNKLSLADNTLLLSVDFTSANFNSLKTYDSKGEIFDSWEELCLAMEIHPFLARSKSFRQYVFGNTNPKRLEKTQHENIVKIVNCLVEDYYWKEVDIVFISHDEFIVRVGRDYSDIVARLSVILNDVAQAASNVDVKMPTHYKIFQNDPIKGGSKGMSVQTIYQIKGNQLTEQYKKLFKAPKNKFYKYFKTHILEEELDRRDLEFMNEGEIAVWATEDDSIAETMVPEGELSYEEVEKEYPVLLKELSDKVPGLSKAQLRKIVNVTLILSDEMF